MNIPDKAVEAAVRALFEDGCGEPKVDAATALEAAAPYIAAQELFTMQTQAPGLNSAALDWLSRRRNELDPQ